MNKKTKVLMVFPGTKSSYHEEELTEETMKRAAIIFEDTFYEKSNEYWERSIKGGGIIEFAPYCYVEAYEFKEIDLKFVDLILSEFSDEEFMTYKNIYILPE